MIQLPAGATASMPAQTRDFGRGCRPGGTPGIQTRHSPGLGRCPGGTPSVVAVLGPAASASEVGTSTMVLVVRVQAATATRVVAKRRSREASRKNVRMLGPLRGGSRAVAKCANGVALGNFSRP